MFSIAEAGIENIAKTLFESVKKTVTAQGKEVWEASKDFAAETTKLYATEKFKAATAGDDEKRQEHETNLEHLIAQIQTHAVIQQLDIQERAKTILAAALETAGNILVTAL